MALVMVMVANSRIGDGSAAWSRQLRHVVETRRRSDGEGNGRRCSGGDRWHRSGVVPVIVRRIWLEISNMDIVICFYTSIHWFIHFVMDFY